MMDNYDGFVCVHEQIIKYKCATVTKMNGNQND